jgi:4-amino-4-deoxy-L-arabinose transferase-like glycosyltransferase
MKGATTNRRVTTSIIAGLALVALIVHLLTIHRYGYFRDELYYVACARHLDFGYVDLAPLSAFLLRTELILFGSSLFALRIFPALTSALTIVFTGILTRELGGRAWAIVLACTSMLGSLFFLAVGNFYSPNVYEPLFWTGAIYLLCRIINGAPSRTWLWFCVEVFLVFLFMHSIVFFVVDIVVEILLMQLRRHFLQ